MAQTTDSSVLSIIAAFTGGLDVFRKLRERRRVRKRRKSSKGSGEKESGEELRLSRSLRRGPVEIRREYEKQYARHGRMFSMGDAAANTSLASTLVKLNSGLVSIITSFLCCKGGDAQPDYRSLTSLSDVSRQEAIEALGQLSSRLSQSSLSPLLPQDACSRCGYGTHHGVCKNGGKTTLTKARSIDPLGGKDSRHNEKEKSVKSRSRRPPAARTIDANHEVRKVHLSSASEPQLAIVRSRPRNRRTTSTSSTSSQTGKSTAACTPPPAYSSPQPSPRALGPPYGHDAYPFPPQPYLITPLQYMPPPRQSPTPQQQFLYPTPSPSPPQPTPFPAHSAPVVRRRADKATPSTFTFASDSTKLGEIPMNKWNIPFNYAEMQRLNEEYYACTSGVQPEENKPKRPGLFGRMFGKKKSLADG